MSFRPNFHKLSLSFSIYLSFPFSLSLWFSIYLSLSLSLTLSLYISLLSSRSLPLSSKTFFGESWWLNFCISGINATSSESRKAQKVFWRVNNVFLRPHPPPTVFVRSRLKKKHLYVSTLIHFLWCSAQAFAANCICKITCISTRWVRFLFWSWTEQQKKSWQSRDSNPGLLGE